MTIERKRFTLEFDACKCTLEGYEMSVQDMQTLTTFLRGLAQRNSAQSRFRRGTVAAKEAVGAQAVASDFGGPSVRSAGDARSQYGVAITGETEPGSRRKTDQVPDELAGKVARICAALAGHAKVGTPRTDRESDPTSASARASHKHTRLPMIDAETEGGVSRLMDKAERALSEPGGRSRRATIAQIRAAVAAKVADHVATPAPGPDAVNPFHRDLATSAARSNRLHATFKDQYGNADSGKLSETPGAHEKE